MDHLLHPFLPGTPENTALLSVLPALLPMYNQIISWFLHLARR